jgi:hypothetical protein
VKSNWEGIQALSSALKAKKIMGSLAVDHILANHPLQSRYRPSLHEVHERQERLENGMVRLKQKLEAKRSDPLLTTDERAQLTAQIDRLTRGIVPLQQARLKRKIAEVTRGRE